MNCASNMTIVSESKCETLRMVEAKMQAMRDTVRKRERNRAGKNEDEREE